MEDPPVGPAIAVEATLRSVRRYLRFARFWSGVGIALLIFTGGLFLSHVRALDIQTEGALTTGTIRSRTTQQLGGGRSKSYVVVQLTRPTNHDQTIWVGHSITTLRTGQTVTVRYDPNDPTRAEIQGVHLPDSIPPLIPLGAGLIVVGFAWPGVRRAHFVHQIMSNDPWDAHPSKLVEVPFDQRFRGRARILLRLDGMTGTVIASAVGLRRINPTFAPIAWVAGFGDEQMVVAPPGGGPVVCVRSIETTPPSA